MAKHYRKKKVKRNRLIYLFLILCIIISSIFIAKYFMNKNKEKSLLNTIKIDETKITEEKTERMLKLEKLQQENNEIVAWIEIENTNISYPVLQGTDNSYYMTHNYKKETAKDGAIFLDKDYNWNLPSTNLLIYGHNNIGSNEMFASLLNYKDENYYKKHPTIKFTTNREDVEYEIIAVFETRVFYKSEKNVFRYYYFINAENEQEYNDFIENSKKSSLYDTGKTAQYGDQLMTLSTCSYHTEDGRFAVVAKRSEK